MTRFWHNLIDTQGGWMDLTPEEVEIGLYVLGMVGVFLGVIWLARWGIGKLRQCDC